MEIKIPKEVRAYKETIFFGFTLRQFVCAAVAVCVAVGVYLLTGAFIGRETASWLCILCAAPFALAGFFRFNGMTFERFVWAVLKSQVLCAGPRVFKSENIYRKALAKKGEHDHA